MVKIVTDFIKEQSNSTETDEQVEMLRVDFVKML